MKVEMFSEGGRNPAVLDASRVLIRDAHGNPIAFAVQYLRDGVSCCIAATAQDADFEALLTTIGVKASTIRNHIVVGDDDDNE